MKKILLLLFVAFFLQAVPQSPRTCLYEEFTGETCGPCASTNPGLNAILLSPINANKVIPIKWQVPIPFAPTNIWSLYQTNKTEIDWRYGPAGFGYGYVSQNSASSPTQSGINSAPQGVLDGQHQWVFGANSDHPAYISNAVIATAQSYTSAFTINMVNEWNSNRSAVIVTVNITASANYTSTGPLVFRCVMVERLIQFSVQPGTNGEKKFEDVAIRSYPSIQAGTSLPSNWTNGQSQTIVLTCTPPSYVRDVNEISMVGFIQDDGNRKVEQAARARALCDAVAIDAILPASCGGTMSPVVSVRNDGLNPITNMTFTPYFDGLAQNTTIWTGNLAVGNSVTLTLDPITAPATSGPHSFSFDISGVNGGDFYLGNNKVQVNFPVFVWPPSFPVVETFAPTVFPPAKWTAVNPDNGITWERTTLAGAYWVNPMESMKYDFFNNSKLGDKDEMYLPALELSGGDQVELLFDYAYAQRSTLSNDQLQVMVSDNCGANWNTVFNKAGANLATASPTQAAYVPDVNEPSQWKTEQIALPGYNKSSVLVKFVVTNNYGNNLYIDNINVVQHAPSAIQINNVIARSLRVYPSPAHNNLSVSVETELDELVELNLMNGAGQIVLNQTMSAQNGANHFQMDVKDLPSGLYLVQVKGKSYNAQQRVVILK